MSLDALSLCLCVYYRGTTNLQCRHTSVSHFSYSAQEISLLWGREVGFFPLQLKLLFLYQEWQRGWRRWLKGTFFLSFWHFKRWAVFSAVLHTSEFPVFERYLIFWLYCILKYPVRGWWFPEGLPILLSSLVRKTGVTDLLSKWNESEEVFGHLLITY